MTSGYFSKKSREIVKPVLVQVRFPAHFGNDIKDIIRNLLQIDLSKRYGNLKNGVNDIKKHRWFSGIDWIAILQQQVFTLAQYSAKIHKTFRLKADNPSVFCCRDLDLALTCTS